MNTLKTLVVLTVLVMVGYGLYVGLNNGFQFENVQTETPEWLHQEMQTEHGIPQVTPPQITEPTMPVQPGAANSVGNNVAPGGAIVAEFHAPFFHHLLFRRWRMMELNFSPNWDSIPFKFSSMSSVVVTNSCCPTDLYISPEAERSHGVWPKGVRQSGPP